MLTHKQATRAQLPMSWRGWHLQHMHTLLAGWTCLQGIPACQLAAALDAPYALVISTHVLLLYISVSVPAHFTAFVHTIFCLVHAEATFQHTI